MAQLIVYDNELCHHGVKGQKWGVRRYRNENGTLTPAGKQKLAEYKKKTQADFDKRNAKKTAKLEKKGKTEALARHKKIVAAMAKKNKKLTLTEMYQRESAVGARLAKRGAIVTILFGAPTGAAVSLASIKGTRYKVAYEEAEASVETKKRG